MLNVVQYRYVRVIIAWRGPCNSYYFVLVVFVFIVFAMFLWSGTGKDRYDLNYDQGHRKLATQARHPGNSTTCRITGVRGVLIRATLGKLRASSDTHIGKYSETPR